MSSQIRSQPTVSNEPRPPDPKLGNDRTGLVLPVAIATPGGKQIPDHEQFRYSLLGSWRPQQDNSGLRLRIYDESDHTGGVSFRIEVSYRRGSPTIPGLLPGTYGINRNGALVELNSGISMLGNGNGWISLGPPRVPREGGATLALRIDSFPHTDILPNSIDLVPR